VLTQTFGILIVKSSPELAKADIFGYNMFAKQDKINVIFKSIFADD